MVKEILPGYKSYIVGASMIFAGLVLMAKGKIEVGVGLILEGFAVMGLRKGIQKTEK